MTGSKKLVMAVVLLIAAGVLLWRPWAKEATGPVPGGGEPVLICVGCGKQFAEGEVEVDLDQAVMGCTCPACGEKKLFRARICPECGHGYVPKFAYTPGASREDDKCPKCGTPTVTKRPK